MLCPSLLTPKVDPMPKSLFITDEEYTFQASAHVLARAILLINDKDESAIFSIADLLCLLRDVNAHVPGEFEIQRTPSHVYKILYKSEEEVIENFRERWEGFIEN